MGAKRFRRCKNAHFSCFPDWIPNVQTCASLVDLKRCCITNISYYFIAKIGFNTAEHEPSEVFKNIFPYVLKYTYSISTSLFRGLTTPESAIWTPHFRETLGGSLEGTEFNIIFAVCIFSLVENDRKNFAVCNCNSVDELNCNRTREYFTALPICALSI